MIKCITPISVYETAPGAMRCLVSVSSIISNVSWCCRLRGLFSNPIGFDGIKVGKKSKPLEFEGIKYGEFATIHFTLFKRGESYHEAILNKQNAFAGIGSEGKSVRTRREIHGWLRLVQMLNSPP
jgi:hypothetical protein